MSYVRWSSDDYKSDVYVYKDVSGGWTTHVAGNRVVLTEELPEPIAYSPERSNEWWERSGIVSRIVGRSEHEAIGLPHDGETFNDESPSLCADRLENLRELGYHVPDGTIESLREEEES